jgi:DNA helicase TIP49 (TBP-interacting protein)
VLISGVEKALRHTGDRMSGKKTFVGRTSYLDEFDRFVNASSSEIDGHVLLVVGDQGMGKTALLQAMAKRAGDQGHVVALGEIDKM